MPITYSSHLNTNNLVIAQNSLQRGTTYTLQALINQNFPFTWNFYVNEGPSGGVLTSDPILGTEMTTQFTIVAAN